MNRFDRESIIIDYFQSLKKKEIFMLHNDFKTRKVFKSIYNQRKWYKWIDSSSKNALPPDFYNDDLQLMMDVMRIDDHAYEDENGKIINPTNIRESKLLDEIASISPDLKTAVQERRVIVNPDSGLRGEMDHNYNFYCKNFNRVINKHLEKIKNYKKNHPGYKVIFLLMDESSPYLKCIDDNRPTIPGELFCGDFHQWWYDYNMMECLIRSELDYLIWFSPYKHFDSVEKFEPPFATIIDVRKMNEKLLIHYDKRAMASMEA